MLMSLPRFVHRSYSRISRPHAFACDRRASSLIEFALIMPVLVILMLGGTELARCVNTMRQVTNLANSLATLMSSRTTAFDYNEAVYTYNSTLVTFPFVLKDAAAKNTNWQYDLTVTLSSVAFTPTVPGCTLGCNYTAKVVWSLNSPTAQTRSCTVAPTAAANTAAPSMSTLPQDAFTSGSIVVADVTFTYTPTFGSAFVSPIVIRRSVYLQPRYLATLQYSTAAGGPYRPC